MMNSQIQKEGDIPMSNSRMLNFGLFLILVTILGLVQGCATQPVRVALDYDVHTKGSPTCVLSGKAFTIEPFDDARTNKLISRNMMMREEDDAGLWIANAIRLELEQAGAQPLAVQKGVRPSAGYHLSGKVNIIESHTTGWQPGGLLGVLTESGANAHMNVTTVLLKDGIEYQTHTYDSSAKIKNSAARNIFIGGTDIPGALEAALQKMIRNQLIPDLQNDLK